MSRSIADTAERMAMLPADVPRDAVIVTRNLQREYDMGGEVVRALRGVDITIRKNEFLAIMGPSGSGKSTLMNLIGCLDTPTAGEYILNGQAVAGLSDDELARIRNREIGFVFQTFNLLPRATALHNVELPLVYAGVPSKDRQERAKTALDKVELSQRMLHRPNELSGGQRQRVAIARAMSFKPRILLYDEPTTGLDPITADTVDDEIIKLRDLEEISSIVVTHQLRDAFRIATHEAVRENGQIRILAADLEKAEEAEFIMLKDGVISFEGHAAELRASKDPYLHTFLS